MKGLGRAVRRLERCFGPALRARRRLFLVGSLAALGLVGARLALPWTLTGILAPWLDGEALPSTTLSALVPGAGLAFLGLFLVHGLCDFRSRVAFSRFAVDVVHDVRSAGLATLAARVEPARPEDDPGDAVARLVGDSARLKEGLKGFLVHVATNGLFFLGVIAVLGWLRPSLAAVMASALLLVSAATVFGALWIARRADLLRRREADLAEKIRRSDRAHLAQRDARLAPRKNRRPWASLTRAQGLTAICVHGVLALALPACLFLAVSGPSPLSSRELFVFASYAFLLLHPAVRLSRQGTRVGKLLPCALRIEELLRPRAGAVAGELAPLERELRLEAVGMGPSRLRPTERLGAVDLAFGAGEKVALLGGPGDGKSTLLEALAARRPRAGRVLWDGQDLAAVPRSRRGERVRRVPERPGWRRWCVDDLLGDATAHTPHGRALLERLGGARRRPLEAGDLSATEIRALWAEWALGRGADVLLLDEPLAGLDREAAGEHARALLAAAGPALVIAALGGEPPLEGFDRVVVLEGGRVAFEGTPVELARRGATGVN